ncbi:precorrin-2 C(20)-methyltransferase [Actinospica sp.]|jgi:precorrin-2/cobalt-factor-2 C20-methyltransferase|uniref:precorrin-2 C(20)-methyltransferase n=1 Tax=Actinospica sp. TaxID=1872142 RepID=UPI002C20155B|nr:precorrin-2 C(20)-methyltransferase [Actinospica sp.]HWG27682.1 precorrin-2 C(20)-methyltransferase [Actinospica sp.]
MRTLIGIGVGPGDPELLTLKAVRLLREADVVFAPTTSLDRESRAEQIVHAATGIRARRLVFALDDQGGVTAERAAAWDEAARAVVEAFEAGARSVGFVTLGDPNVYSTFGYLAQTVAALDAEVQVTTVPGVTAMQDLAARADLRLAEGREPLTLVPATAGLDEVARALSGNGTVVVYKGGRFLDELTAAVDAAGRADAAVLGTDLGLETENIGALKSRDGGRAPYFTTLIVPPARGGRGEKL